MNRRNFMQTACVASAGLLLPDMGTSLAEAAPADAWRTFQVTTRIEVLRPSGQTRIWAPAALITKTAYQMTYSNEFKADGGKARIIESRPNGLAIVSAEFPSGVKPVLTVTSRVDTRNYSVDLSRASGSARGGRASRTELQHFLRATRLLPTDGIVKETAMGIVKGASTDQEKAKAIYEWIVDNTFREPKVRGCGTGDIRFMLESRDLGGKCADLNALFVGLSRSVGVPARDVYGIRVAKSDLGYKSLGASSDNVTKSQHCRAEVYLEAFGWTPVDPADVRKVVLEEPPGNLPLDNDMVKKARSRLFGSWEMNWMAFNFAHDVELPGSTGQPLGFLMYPQAETAAGRLDSLDPDNFKYEITGKEIQ